MNTTPRQRTIGGSAVVEGFGYWSGRDIRVEFRPADADTGLVFVRADLPGQPRIPARVENRVNTPLRSSLRRGQANVEMVEHIVASLGGLGIDNCEVWVDEAEMPGCDGSSLPFVEALDSAGVVIQDAARRQAAIREPMCVCDGAKRLHASPSADGRTRLTYHLDYGPGPIGRQTFAITLSPDEFRRELAPSRTFLLQAEADRLRAAGLGGRAGFGDLLVFGPDGPIDNTLRFPDECVRHKVLDLLGDLTLAGGEVVGSFWAWRSGHELNARLVAAMPDQLHAMTTYRRCA